MHNNTTDRCSNCGQKFRSRAKYLKHIEKCLSTSEGDKKSSSTSEGDEQLDFMDFDNVLVE